MNKQIFVLYFNIFLIFLGIGLVIPVLPVYLKDLGLTGSDLGLLVAAFALSQMIISPFGGTLADKLGKKLIICIGLILFSVSEFMFAVGHNFSVLMLSRVIGGFMAEVSHRMPFYFAGALGILAFIMSIVLIHDPKKSTTSGFQKLEPQLLTKINWKVFITPVILTLVLSFGLSAFETLYSLYTADKVNYSPKDISIAITGGGIFGALFQIYFFDKFMKYFSELTFIAWSLLYSVVVLILLVFANGYWSIMLISFVVFIGFDMIRPAITNYFSNIAGERQGFAGGLNSTFTSMGNFIGPLIAGALFDVHIEAPIYMAIGVSLAGVVIVLIEKQHRAKLKEQNM
ncbi:multidrug efflux MFS transporter NorA [Staphylococcus aureus]|nr:multidrug efflux MFS transporter NorA [Staphylococcus aureus]HCX0379322.1 multidrug efflux MFS transporter NorA [Staphylococcus aureus]